MGGAQRIVDTPEPSKNGRAPISAYICRRGACRTHRFGDCRVARARCVAHGAACAVRWAGDRWSPETLLIASIADCFVLTFRAVSRAARFQWLHVECRVESVLERIDGGSQFARYTTRATLTVPSGADEATARKLLEKAENGCLIANSLRGMAKRQAPRNG